MTLWDKLQATNPGESEEERLKMHKMASAIVFTSQGIPFIHAAQELVRTKFGDSNSYKSPDAINQIDWSRKLKYAHVFAYNQGLIALRKAHPAFRMPTTKQIQNHLEFLPIPSDLMVGFCLNDHANGDPWKTIVVLFNASLEDQLVSLPGEGWIIVVDGERAGVEALGTVLGDTVIIPARSSLVLVDAQSFK